mmetsp:Transcript_8248/g.12623  ORF Transcript_8248/g.12623 Transcript_8248/m.12623 type:complete len:118 (-) Transcript_8248:1659-2012(-)
MIKQGKEEQKEKEEKPATSGGVVPDPKSAAVTPGPTPGNDDESVYFKDLYELKKKYKPYYIYIFECKDCSLFMMLHHQKCPHCERENMYFDETLKVGPEIEQDVMKELSKIQKSLKM